MSRLSSVVLLLALFFSAVLAAPKQSCNQTQVATVKKAFNVPKDFCNWYLDYKQTKSPVNALTRAQFSKACTCITKKKQSTKAASPVTNPGAAPKCSSAQKKALQKEAKKTSEFCKYWNTAKWRADSPFEKINVRSVYNACKCFAKTNSTSSATPRPSSSSVATITMASSTSSMLSNSTASVTLSLNGTLPTTTSVLSSFFNSSITSSHSSSITLLSVLPSTGSFTSTGSVSSTGTVSSSSVSSEDLLGGLLSTSSSGSSISGSTTTTASITSITLSSVSESASSVSALASSSSITITTSLESVTTTSASLSATPSATGVGGLLDGLA
ncbi:hypothetical protein BDZ85DRAFT_252279 [Elsinoe ampelina]|uniref:Extracellular membrane protein CFEM domain-containing protein n=1 Tax=Elsinoe ampelina TaxID=302913 RepID=A0A6A6G4J7_9PEZI|nr:hypothetical protein BDZ85DRAFT_252279 [Elsinoe ampelina]